MSKIVTQKLSGKLLVLVIVFAIGLGLGREYSTRNSAIQQTEKDTPKVFVSEIYDKIKENYWNNISDGELLDLFKISMDKNGGNVAVAKFENKDKFLAAVDKITAGMNEEQKNRFIITVAGSVISSLAPAGRSGLYTQKQEEQLKNTVSNINPEKDLYKDLGLAKGASGAAVAEAYQKKAAELSLDKSPEAKEKLKTITYAKDTLTQKDTKERYDTNQVEPTLFNKVIAPGILYVQFKKFSPTSLDEFQKAFESYKDNPGLNALIFDLRGNIGGAIDATAYFLGFFLGKGQYAFDFYHKGEYLPFKTATDKLPSLTKYKQVVVLVDQNSQSSAEMMAAALKKYHVGVVVGVPTKGWGTVERVFPLVTQISKKEKYSIFLVHSITLRDDNLPIEGRGVDPDVKITDSNWTTQLLLYFNNPTLVETVKSVL
ncbi:DnaJ domain-containing protein [Candidatus Daviesbacteria bacterium]|nr:DnaJ domain-containing protein [Candidatus Daviesbacteria bacterium]